jgi:hypothetical protein
MTRFLRLHATVEVVLTPWTWEWSYWRHGRDVELRSGPFWLTVIDG